MNVAVLTNADLSHLFFAVIPTHAPEYPIVEAEMIHRGLISRA